MNIIVLDNDECLGYFGLINTAYHTMTHYFKKNDIKLNSKLGDKFKDLFTEMSVELLELGYARPNLEELFSSIREFKEEGLIKYLVMMTSADRYYDKSHKEYSDWLVILRNIFEKYSNKKNPELAHIPLYDYDHSCRSDEANPVEMNGRTQKRIETILDKIKITGDHIKSIFFFDDAIQNIRWDSPKDIKKLIKVGVDCFYGMPNFVVFKQTIDKYAPKFVELGYTRFMNDILDNYKDESKELKEYGFEFDKNPASTIPFIHEVQDEGYPKNEPALIKRIEESIEKL